MNADVQSCLAKILNTTRNNIEQIIKEEKATTYLWVWSIFEQKIFDGFMTKEKIKDKALYFEKSYDALCIENIVEKFYERYQDKQKLRNLLHNDKKTDLKKILDNNYKDLSKNDKLYLLFFVAYRYRNNIFHGNKGVLSWINYTKQIDACIKFMINIINEAFSQERKELL